MDVQFNAFSRTAYSLLLGFTLLLSACGDGGNSSTPADTDSSTDDVLQSQVDQLAAMVERRTARAALSAEEKLQLEQMLLMSMPAGAAPESGRAPASEDAPVLDPAEMDALATMMAEQLGGTADSAELPADTYQTRLAVDEEMQLPGTAGELRVWIGRSADLPPLPQGMASDSAPLPMSTEAKTVKIEPYAPAFTIAPATSACIALDPSGSEVRFSLTPLKAGIFRVSASVYLYSSADCSGVPLPKSTETLEVRVKVNAGGIFGDGLSTLGGIFWTKLVEFWEVLTGLIFALLLFLIRGKLKKRFGFDDGKQ